MLLCMLNTARLQPIVPALILQIHTQSRCWLQLPTTMPTHTCFKTVQQTENIQIPACASKICVGVSASSKSPIHNMLNAAYCQFPVCNVCMWVREASRSTAISHSPKLLTLLFKQNLRCFTDCFSYASLDGAH